MTEFRFVLSLLVLAAIIPGCTPLEPSQTGPGLQNPPAPFAAGSRRQVMVKAKPGISRNGIFAGDKGICVFPEGRFELMAGGRKLAEFFYYFSTPYSPWITTNCKGLRDRALSRQPRGFNFSAKVPLAAKGTAGMPLADYTQKLTLLNDGRINVHMLFSVPAGMRVKDRCLFFQIPFHLAQNTQYTVDGKAGTFPRSAGAKGANLYSGKAGKFTFGSPGSDTGFSLAINRAANFWIRDRKDGNINFRIIPDKQRTVDFTIDLGLVAEESLKSSADSHAGIDFWKCDRLHVPDYSASMNLIQNPSFEAGLRYYTLHETWGVYKPEQLPVYGIDEEEGKFGHASLLINAPADNRRTCFLQTFAIPVIANQKYTFSLYARAETGKTALQLQSITGRWLQFPKIGGTRITTDWKRYSFTFTAPNRAVTILLRGLNYSQKPQVRIWVDGMQLNEGEKALPYQDQKLNAVLQTSDPDNFLNLDTPVNASLKITTIPETTGTVQCRVVDYFYRELWQARLPFVTDRNGVAKIRLPLDGRLGRGIFVVQADFKLANGYRKRDFFRIARMRFLRGLHRNKNIFASNMYCGITREPDWLQRLQRIGMGAMNYVRAEKHYSEMFAKYRIKIMGLGIFSHGQTVKTGNLRQKIRKLVSAIKGWSNLTPEREKLVENMAYAKAASMPWIDHWFFAGECEAGGGSKYKLIASGNIKDFSRMLVATWRGVKRFNRNKQVYLCGGPCNMMPQGGIRWLDRYLTCINNAVKFDGIAIHPYRTVPENPDLDDDTAKLLAMLHKHGYDDVPVYWNEGIYYTYYNIPAWGLNPHKGCSTDHYRAWCPSYHMGWGERISAAYFARSWLVALKYQDRVKEFNGWCSWMYMDTYLTPLAIQKIPNTLGNLLGNACFKKDIRFAPNTRCYVFEDMEQRPVAAMWSHIPKVDHGFQQSPTARIRLAGLDAEVIDLMGNAHKPKADSTGTSLVPVTWAPAFIRTAPGTLEKLCLALTMARLTGDAKPGLKTSIRLRDRNTLTITVNNTISRPFTGRIIVGDAPHRISRPIRMLGLDTAQFTMPLPAPVRADRITRLVLPLRIQEQGHHDLKSTVALEVFAARKLCRKIQVDGDLADWKDIPGISLHNRMIMKTAGSTSLTQLRKISVGYPGDFEARFKAAWDDQHFYLAVMVTDDKFVRLPDKRGRFGWYNDTLQTYFDTMCDARSHTTRGFDGNDYNYDFFPDPRKHAAVAFRRFAPDQQVAGGLLAPKPNMVEPNVKAVFRQTSDGYVYEIAFPRRYLTPMRFEAGSTTGFCVYLNDRDGKHIKSALTLTPSGTGGYMNPHLYPVMLLVE